MSALHAVCGEESAQATPPRHVYVVVPCMDCLYFVVLLPGAFVDEDNILYLSTATRLNRLPFVTLGSGIHNITYAVPFVVPKRSVCTTVGQSEWIYLPY
jgi:hypothetical protein